MLRKLTLVVSMAGLLAACTGRVTEAEAGPRPVNYKATLRAYIRETFFDPYSLMDVAVSEPVPGTMLLKNGWVVCFQANAKNRYGAYVGLKRTSFLFQGEDLVEAPDAEALACEGVPLQPWPGMLVTSAPQDTSAPASPGDPNRKPELGIHLWPDSVVAAMPNLVGEGVAVMGVQGDGPAARAGMRPGDHILTYDGHAVGNWQELKVLVDGSPIGKPIPVEIKRGDERMALILKL